MIRVRSEPSSRPTGRLHPVPFRFGATVRRLREDSGLSMRGFCAKAREVRKPEGTKGVGLGLKALWQIETGRVVPRPSSVYVINRVLGTALKTPDAW